MFIVENLWKADKREVKMMLNLPVRDSHLGRPPPGYFEYRSLPHWTPEISSVQCEAKAIVFLQFLTALKSYKFILQVIFLSYFSSLNVKKKMYPHRKIGRFPWTVQSILHRKTLSQEKCLFVGFMTSHPFLVSWIIFILLTTEHEALSPAPGYI